MPKQQEPTIQASVQVPSSDLINYRFDQADIQFDKLNKKLDDMTNHFVTTAYLADLKLEGDKRHTELQNQIDAINRNARWWVGTLLTVATVVIGAVAIFHK